MKLNRSLQQKILKELADHYPEGYPDEFRSLDDDEEGVIAALHYLDEHGLIEHGLTRYLDGGYTTALGATRITAKGLDFLADDGGLSAILGIVTIKFHDDTLKSLIEAKILQSDLAQPDKNRWLDQLRSLPAETTKHLALKLVDLGLENAPAALAAIGTILKVGV